MLLDLSLYLFQTIIVSAEPFAVFIIFALLFQDEKYSKQISIGSSIFWQIGKTKVFLRAGQMAELDALRNEVLGRSAIIIQRKFRTHLFHKWFMGLQWSAIQIQAYCRGTPDIALVRNSKLL